MVDMAQNPLELSDEDFAKLPLPTEEAASDPATVEAPEDTSGANSVPDANEAGQQGEAAGEGQGEGEGTGAEASGTESEGSGGGNPADGSEGTESGATPSQAEAEPKKEGAEAPKPKGAVSPSGSGEAEKKPDGVEGAAPKEPDHKAFYEKVMAPFMANGKEIKLQSPDEVIQLMQQGANYTRKMQAIAPHRRLLTMAQNNNIDEERLSFLIDLDKGNPDAIQKLLKDKQVDVLNIDTESETTYLGGNHKVSDNEVSFQTNLSELSSTPEGTATLQTIDSTWDDASKEVLWAEPGLMPVIHAQKQSGIYDRISAEVDRRRMLGHITPETSFINAYRLVGDEMLRSGGFNDLVKPEPAQTEQRPSTPVVKTPVATTAATPKPVIDNGDKASAASPTRSTPKTAKAITNPLAMSDEEFEAQFAKFQGRV